ncbi:MAG TPA: 50S ribosomal protein L20 [Planctomycetes bacterium]|nr:50S ribosomal protein L20 [Planctomycetota bacterium]
MSRVRFGVARHRKQKRVLRKARGFWGARSRQYRTAKEAVMRSEVNATRDRRYRKRNFRRLWITRISAAAVSNGISYSRLMHGLRKAEVDLNRKMLSELAIRNAEAFESLVAIARSSGGA